MSRIHLTLKDKIKVLKQFKVGKSSRNIAKEFGVGKTQILNILKNKEEIEKLVEDNISSKRKNIHYKGNLSDFFIYTCN